MNQNKPRKGRAVQGVLVFDKPLSLSSNTALQKVKRVYSAQKAGHTGSLDPLATGLLPICFGEATKLSQYVLDADKTYEVTAHLGIKTTTADAEGDVLMERSVQVTLDQIQTALEKFRGTMTQIPSMYSALKHEGRPLYELARRGIEVERAAREIVIHELTVLSFETPFIRLKVRCSKGTYVRNLVEDLGEALGCGAYVSALRRLSAGPYEASQMVSYDELLALENNFELLDQLLLPADSLVQHLPCISLGKIAAFQLGHGSAVQVSERHAGSIRLYNEQQKLLGIGEFNEEGLLAPKRLFAAAI